MSDEKKKIEFWASIKEVKVKTLATGDKETRIVLSIVGADCALANLMTDVPPEKQIKVVYEKD